MLKTLRYDPTKRITAEQVRVLILSTLEKLLAVQRYAD